MDGITEGLEHWTERGRQVWERRTAGGHCGELDGEEGSSTVEYAIGAIAAAAFAGVLLVVVKSGAVKTALAGIIQQALSTGG